MKQHTAAALLALGATAAAAPAARAQRIVSRPAAPGAALGGDDDDRARLGQLRGDTLDGFLLRSPSSRAARLGPAAPRGGGDSLFVAPWWPQLSVVYNSALPFTLNDGALWAGRGTSASVTGGVRVRYRALRVVVAPTYVHSENREFALPYDSTYSTTPPPAPRSPYSYPWRWYGRSIDLPLRFGGRAYRRLDLGQSALYASVGRVEVGLSNENEWWGPGVRNALLMSDNAPGIPKLFVRTARPIATAVGQIEARYLLGALSQSPYFETTVEARRGRSLSAAAVTLRPAIAPALTLGAARAVYAQTGPGGDLFEHVFDVLGRTGRPNAIPSYDGLQRPGQDQIYTFFARYVLPDDGFESYVEWGRTEVPVNVRDFFVSPNHTQGYTLGLQYARPVRAGGLTARVQAEYTNVAQSNTFAQRPTGSWYTSRAAVQGYTQRGQVIGAAIGPGAASQWLASDLVARRWTAGVFAGRIRWDDDAQYDANAFGGYCRHDVSVFGGARGTARLALGTVSASVTTANRLNVFYQNARACVEDTGPRVDERNLTLTFGFAPSGR